MTDKGFDENDEVRPDAEGAEPQASAPEAQSDQAADAEELTVEDILDAEQTEEAAGAEHSDYETQLLGDLKRIQAEYANYRRRTEEQRELEIQRAKAEVAKRMLPVLDDLDRAEKHGDLAECSAFAVIAEKLRGVVENLLAE